MSGHICFVYTMTILGVHIFHYYSSNSITSNYIVFTRVKNFCLRSVAHARAQSGHVDRRVQMSVQSYRHAASTRACALRCMRFLTYFLRFRCLNVTTLFNIDVKIRFRAVVTASCSAAILRRCCGHVYCSTRVPGISVYIFPCNCTVQARNYGTVQF